MNLPKWRSHKIVEAFKIGGIPRRHDGIILTDAAVETPVHVQVDAAWIMRFKPQLGGYYVRYEDGYASYSPAGPFEAGYTRVEENPTHETDPTA